MTKSSLTGQSNFCLFHWKRMVQTARRHSIFIIQMKCRTFVTSAAALSLHFWKVPSVGGVDTSRFPNFWKQRRTASTNGYKKPNFSAQFSSHKLSLELGCQTVHYSLLSCPTLLLLELQPIAGVCKPFRLLDSQFFDSSLQFLNISLATPTDTSLILHLIFLK